MFEPKDNPGYEKLTSDAAQLIAKWTTNDWYESSTEGEIAPEHVAPEEMVPEEIAPDEG